MESSSSLNPSIAISAAGWVLAVIAVATALFVGKPYYAAQGYENGRLMQAENNMKAVDAILASRGVEGAEYVVIGRSLEAGNGRVVIEALNPYLNNPLRKGFRTQTVSIDAETVIEKRTVLPQEEFIRALEEARQQGLSTQDAVVHASEPLTLEQIPVGTEIRVYPRVAQDAVKDSFVAKQILWVISSHQPSPNQVQL